MLRVPVIGVMTPSVADEQHCVDTEVASCESWDVVGVGLQGSGGSGTGEDLFSGDWRSSGRARRSVGIGLACQVLGCLELTVLARLVGYPPVAFGCCLCSSADGCRW